MQGQPPPPKFWLNSGDQGGPPGYPPNAGNQALSSGPGPLPGAPVGPPGYDPSQPVAGFPPGAPLRVDQIPLPPWFEERVDEATGKTYYVDLTTQTVSWEDPRVALVKQHQEYTAALQRQGAAPNLGQTSPGYPGAPSPPPPGYPGGPPPGYPGAGPSNYPPPDLVGVYGQPPHGVGPQGAVLLTEEQAKQKYKEKYKQKYKYQSGSGYSGYPYGYWMPFWSPYPYYFHGHYHGHSEEHHHHHDGPGMGVAGAALLGGAGGLAIGAAGLAALSVADHEGQPGGDAAPQVQVVGNETFAEGEEPLDDGNHDAGDGDGDGDNGGGNGGMPQGDDFDNREDDGGGGDTGGNDAEAVDLYGSAGPRDLPGGGGGPGGHGGFCVRCGAVSAIGRSTHKAIARWTRRSWWAARRAHLTLRRGTRALTRGVRRGTCSRVGQLLATAVTSLLSAMMLVLSLVIGRKMAQRFAGQMVSQLDARMGRWTRMVVAASRRGAALHAKLESTAAPLMAVALVPLKPLLLVLQLLLALAELIGGVWEVAHRECMVRYYQHLHRHELPQLRVMGADDAKFPSLVSSVPVDPQAICIVTQLSLDRLASLEAMALTWGGAISAAVYASSRGQLACWYASIAALHARVEAAQRCHLDITIVLEMVHMPGRGGSASSSASAPLYPVNSLRNVALGAAVTETVFLLDVDFVPSARLHERLMASPRYAAMREGMLARRHLYVVPAFELGADASSSFTRTEATLAGWARHAHRLTAGNVSYAGGSLSAPFHPVQLPLASAGTTPQPPSVLPPTSHSTKAMEAALRARVAARMAPILATLSAEFGTLQLAAAHGHVRPFHCAHFPAGHVPTDFKRFLSQQDGGSMEAYPVAYREYFEPYVIGARSAIPRYDERFRGYGLNKISHLYAAAVAGFRFLVLPFAFVVAAPHVHSDAWERTFGASRDPRQKLRIQGLYRRFKQETRAVLAVKGAAPAPRATSTAVASRAMTAARQTPERQPAIIQAPAGALCEAGGLRPMVSPVTEEDLDLEAGAGLSHTDKVASAPCGATLTRGLTRGYLPTSPAAADSSSRSWALWQVVCKEPLGAAVQLLRMLVEVAGLVATEPLRKEGMDAVVAASQGAMAVPGSTGV